METPFIKRHETHPCKVSDKPPLQVSTNQFGTIEVRQCEQGHSLWKCSGLFARELASGIEVRMHYIQNFDEALATRLKREFAEQGTLS